MSDLYKEAAQRKLRFDSRRGALTVEQLFDLPLTSQSGFDLDTVARGVNAELKALAADGESFVEDASTNPRQRELTIALDILKDVIKTRKDANQAAATKRQKAERRQKILDAMARRDEHELSSATKEELEKMLAEVD